MLNKAIIGKKVGMTQIFNADGKVIPCTVIEAGPCVVTQLKTEEKDGYNAVQFGFEDVKEARLNKPQKGHLKKAGVEAKKHLKEFKLDAAADMNVGDVIKADTFASGDRVDVVGTSKGKGYAGVIKRWNFQRLKESHGTGPVARHAGSLGACSSPSPASTAASRDLRPVISSPVFFENMNCAPMLIVRVRASRTSAVAKRFILFSPFRL